MSDRPSEHAVDGDRKDGQAASVGPIRLAILDDHPLVREGLAALLRDAEAGELQVA